MAIFIEGIETSIVYCEMELGTVEPGYYFGGRGGAVPSTEALPKAPDDVFCNAICGTNGHKNY